MQPTSTPLTNLTPTTCRSYKFNFNKTNWLLYASKITSLLPASYPTDPLVAYKAFTNTVFQAAVLSIPEHKTHSINYTSPMWWKAESTTAIKNRSIAFRNFRWSRSKPDFLLYRNQCKNLLLNATVALLNILNVLFNDSVVPSIWRQFKVILIPKPNSSLTAYI